MRSQSHEFSYFLNCEKDLESLAEEYFSTRPAEAEDNQLYVYSSDSSDETDQEIDSDVDFNFSECDLSERSKVQACELWVFSFWNKSLVSGSTFYSETKWNKVYPRSRVHCVTFLFCIYNNLIVMGKSELKWTAYNKYLTTELRQQILNLTEVVKQFTALKCLHQHESEPASMPLFDDDSDFSTLNSEAVASLVSFYSSPHAQTYQKTATSSKEPTESQRPVLSTLCQSHKENLSLVLSSPMIPSRPPLEPFDQNVSPIVSGSHGPTNQQRTQSNRNCSEGNWDVYCCPCFC